ncbi:nitroreductase family protein [Cloacibacillus sp. An23]|uniref:nitroreductase family protein n=1 Tax=Cloacibacillus sp. An23 TaxID=1965591 RepID=UPI000B393BA0|nr:nitroreductase family protein [Cloacibacillus sp. An23]OUO91356.1 hypothetical protein B5F39_13000 [Cloacibacillus sp. An23]
MKKILILAAALMLAASSCAFAVPIVLPEPQKSGGPGLFDMLSKRASAQQQDFTKEELTLNELSTLLWAATGQNREPKGWTVPMAMGRDPYVSVYVMLKDGGYLYNWEKNALIEINADKRALKRTVNQDYAKTAPCILVFVDRGVINMNGFGELATGAMSQNVYLAAAALGLDARFIASFNRAAIEESLNLGPVMNVVGVMAVGRQ